MLSSWLHAAGSHALQFLPRAGAGRPAARRHCRRRCRAPKHCRCTASGCCRADFRSRSGSSLAEAARRRWLTAAHPSLAPAGVARALLQASSNATRPAGPAGPKTVVVVNLNTQGQAVRLERRAWPGPGVHRHGARRAADPPLACAPASPSPHLQVPCVNVTAPFSNATHDASGEEKPEGGAVDVSGQRGGGLCLPASHAVLPCACSSCLNHLPLLPGPACCCLVEIATPFAPPGCRFPIPAGPGCAHLLQLPRRWSTNFRPGEGGCAGSVPATGWAQAQDGGEERAASWASAWAGRMVSGWLATGSFVVLVQVVLLRCYRVCSCRYRCSFVMLPHAGDEQALLAAAAAERANCSDANLMPRAITTVRQGWAAGRLDRQPGQCAATCAVSLQRTDAPCTDG